MKPAVLVLAAAFLAPAAAHSQQDPLAPASADQRQRAPDFERMLRDQAETDRRWRAASEGVKRVDKVTLPQPRRRARQSRPSSSSR